jgi:hypothetical protein
MPCVWSTKTHTSYLFQLLQRDLPGVQAGGTAKDSAATAGDGRVNEDEEEKSSFCMSLSTQSITAFPKKLLQPERYGRSAPPLTEAVPAQDLPPCLA